MSKLTELSIAYENALRDKAPSCVLDDIAKRLRQEIKEVRMRKDVERENGYKGAKP